MYFNYCTPHVIALPLRHYAQLHILPIVNSQPGPYVPPECPANEYFEVCSYKCPSENCSTIPEEPCDPGDGCCYNACRCIEAHSRNKAGKCIPYDQCGKLQLADSTNIGLLSKKNPLNVL